MYYRKTENVLIHNIINNIEKTTLYENRNIPYNLLNDREFEILTYYLFKEEFINSLHKYDSIDLMSGIAEKGRDCVLYKDSKIVAVVQCKHSKVNSKMHRPACAKEIIKFVLNVIEYDIIDDKTNIEYYFIHSEGFSEPAQKLLNTFNTNIVSDISQLKLWVNDVKKSYKTLSHINYDKIESTFINILKTIKIIKLEGVDIDNLVDKYTKIIDMFFIIKKVVIDEPELPRDFEDEKITSKNMNIYNSEKFVKKLQEIKLKKPSVINAITDYWRMNNTLKLIIENDYVQKERLEKYESDLCDKFINQYDNACENLNDKLPVERQSRIFYRNIINMNPIKIIDLKNNRPFFQRGYYHDLINSDCITCWKLKPYEEDDIDE